MLGWVTIFAFIFAFLAGGWWWLVAIVLVLIWGNRQNALQESSKSITNEPSVRNSPAEREASLPITNSLRSHRPSPPRNTSSRSAPPSEDFGLLVSDACERVSGPDFFVAEMIPGHKLAACLQNYPVPDRGPVIALIDATVGGSAKNGMAIGEHGLSWNNDWTTKSKRTSFRWDELENVQIRRRLTSIEIGHGNVFDMAGCQFDKTKLVSLLSYIKTLSEQRNRALAAKSMAESKTRNEAPSQTSSPGSPKPKEIDINVADFGQLATLPGIGAAEAKLILKRRESGQPFRSLEDMVNYLGTKPHTAVRLQNMVKFSIHSSTVGSTTTGIGGSSIEGASIDGNGQEPNNVARPGSRLID